MTFPCSTQQLRLSKKSRGDTVALLPPTPRQGVLQFKMANLIMLTARPSRTPFGMDLRGLSTTDSCNLNGEGCCGALPRGPARDLVSGHLTICTYTNALCNPLEYLISIRTPENLSVLSCPFEHTGGTHNTPLLFKPRPRERCAAARHSGLTYGRNLTEEYRELPSARFSTPLPHAPPCFF